jgi:hypothetical protein
MAQVFTALWDAVAPGANVWMATPDIIEFYVDDDPIIPGNIVSGDFSAMALGTWALTPNTGKPGNPSEWAHPLGATKNEAKFSDLPPPGGYLDKVALHTLANYGITGGGGVTISAIYYRDEPISQGAQIVASSGSTQSIIHQRHYIMLKLSGTPSGTLTITNTTAGIDPVTFTFNDKVTRAGGIQINQMGHRPNDALKYAFLAARIPKGPNNGCVQFGAAPYSMTSFQILDSTKATVFTGSIVQRCSSAAVTGEGYDAGIDLADLSQGWAITAVSKATFGVVTVAASPTHTIAVDDKVRFFGINGMTQLENPPTTYTGNAGIWVAATVTAVSGNDITINVNTTGFGTFTNTTLLSEALGGVNNKIYKCFNTNRAGTYVYGLDYSSWTPSASGTYYIYIPGYGISDPLYIASDRWKVGASKLHEGLFNIRHGIAVSSASGYSRGISLKDGTNGVTNYKSTMVAYFCSESSQYPSLAAPGVVHNSMGAFAGISGIPVLTALTCSGTTATATLASPHGIATNGTFMIQPVSCLPAGYNSATAIKATATGTNTFTYTVASGTAATATTLGFIRTGFVTNVRHSGHVGHQDAGDNDDPGVDHLGFWRILALAFLSIPKPSRFTSFTVPLSSAVLDPVLFAGTDAMPPLFHEMFWYAEAYRSNQEADGSVWGGHNVSAWKETNDTLISSVAPFPETIDKYRGTDAKGSLAGQRVYAFSYARDHFTNFHYAGYAAQLAQIAYDYDLTTLGDTYKASAIAAYAWADNLATNPTAADAYYKGVLNLKDKMGWTEAIYQSAILQMTGYTSAATPGRLAKIDAAGSMFRLLGSTAGAAYGDLFTHSSATTATITNSGSGYVAGEILTFTTGSTYTAPIRIVVLTVDGGGAILTKAFMNVGQYTVGPTNPASQTSTTGSGSGAQFTITGTALYNIIDEMLGNYEYCATPGANGTAKGYMQSRAPNSQPALGMNPAMGYMGMFWRGTGANTGGGAGFTSAFDALQAHLHHRNQSLASPETSDYLKLMQAGAGFSYGANLQNKSFVTGTGTRSVKLTLHDDSFRFSSPPPNGLTPFTYSTWATSTQMNSNFQGSVVGADGASIYNSDNVTGSNEGLATPGSAKMWNPWRGGSSYWEWQPENRAIIFCAEFVQRDVLLSLATQLYLHGWDGNT